jgi:hypothetical protein
MSIVKNSARAKIEITPTAGTKLTFCELEITPPGMEAGEDLDVTTSCSPEGYRETIGSSFIKITEASSKVSYDPDQYAEIGAALGEQGKGVVVITFNDGQTVTFNGYLKTFTPDSMATNEDNQPTASITIMPSGGALPVAG